ncbi:MAG: SMP-30/gluconolactonase/LRE family protein [Chitinophagaceae bacterium]|nr:SMP-30/gluconolactonase/LRE family protein [Chitinophagaceae bacterium]
MKYIFSIVFLAWSVLALAQTPRIEFEAPYVYPEGVVYYPANNTFFVSSVKTGTIGTVSENGEYKVFYEDSTLKSTFGMKVDPKQNKLWVCAGDPNYSKYSTPATYKKMIRLISIDIKSGKKINDIDLSALYHGKHFLNDLALDNTGNIYLTDSFSPVVYRVDSKGRASVFAQSDLFKSIDVGLNGIVWSPKGFLIVDNNSDGCLYKIDIKNPTQITRIRNNIFFVGADGLLWDNTGHLIVVQNKGVNKIYQLSSTDNWQTSEVIAATSGADRFKQPSTATMQQDKIYVLNSKLNELSNPTMPPSIKFSLQLAKFQSLK